MWDFVSLFTFWDYILWYFVLWDYIRIDFVPWDFVLWDLVTDSCYPILAAAILDEGSFSFSILNGWHSSSTISLRCLENVLKLTLPLIKRTILLGTRPIHSDVIISKDFFPWRSTTIWWGFSSNWLVPSSKLNSFEMLHTRAAERRTDERCRHYRRDGRPANIITISRNTLPHSSCARISSSRIRCQKQIEYYCRCGFPYGNGEIVDWRREILFCYYWMRFWW